MPYSKLVASVTERRSFDHFARLVRAVLGTRIALVTLVEPHQQVFVGSEGMDDGPMAGKPGTPISHSLCRYVTADQRPLVVADARVDPRLADHPAVLELDVVAYAGWPLLDARGRAVGSLCAIETEPRNWTERDLQLLADLAQACSAELQAMWQQEQESENLLRTIFECVDVAIVFYDTGGRLVMANGPATRAGAAAGVDLDVAPHVGPHVYRADNRTAVPGTEQVIPRALRGELGAYEKEWVGPPGQQIALVAAARQVLRTDGTPRGTLVTAHDVSELARSVAVREEFVTTVSHELRTPLTSILGYLEVLADHLGADDRFVGETVATIERNALRLQQRVEQLLDTADRRRRLDLQPTDLRELAAAVVGTLGEAARAAGVALRLRADADPWATVDRAKLEQALENLVTNAIKYSPDGGAVEIDVRSADGRVTVAVRDEGIGMSPDEVAQAGTTFWRAESATRAAVPGLGIGLTLVSAIVAAHHGDVGILSSPGQGTTVTLSVPTSLGLVTDRGRPRE